MPDVRDLLREAGPDVAPFDADRVRERVQQRARRRRIVEVAAASVAVVALAGGVAVFTRTDRDSGDRLVEVGQSIGGTATATTARTAEPADQTTTTSVAAPPVIPSGPATFEVPGASGVAVANGSVWVAAGLDVASEYPDGGAVVRLDALTGAEQARIDIPCPAQTLAVAGSSLWVGGGGDGGVPVGCVVRIDTFTGTVAAQVDSGLGPDGPWTPYGIAAGQDAVWITDASNRRVLRVDPVTAEVVDTVDLVDQPTNIAAQGDDVWVATAGGLRHLDAATGAVAETYGGTGRLSADRYVWLSVGDETVAIDDAIIAPDGGLSAGTSIRAHGLGGAIAAQGDGVWIGDGDGVVYVRPADGLVTEVEGSRLDWVRVDELAAGEGSVWLLDREKQSVTRWAPALDYADCPTAYSPRRSPGADGMPRQGDTDLAYVNGVLHDTTSDIFFESAYAVELLPRHGQVWIGEGELVDAGDDWQILVRLAEAAGCPDSPYSWNGVPLAFAVDRR